MFGLLTVAACAPPDLPPTPVAVAADTRALVTVPSRGGALLTVTSPAFANDGDIPTERAVIDRILAHLATLARRGPAAARGPPVPAGIARRQPDPSGLAIP